MYPYSEMIILQHATRNMFIPCPDGAHSSKPGSQVPTTPKVRLQLPHAGWHASISVCGPHIAAGRAAHSAFYSMHFTFLACAAMHFFFLVRKYSRHALPAPTASSSTAASSSSW